MYKRVGLYSPAHKSKHAKKHFQGIFSRPNWKSALQVQEFQGLKKLELNSSLPFGQTPLKYSLRRASLYFFLI